VSLTSVRQALAAHLSDTLGVAFVDGYVEGPVHRTELGCSYPITKTRVEDLELDETLTVAVRFFQKFTKPAGRSSGAAGERRVDPARLEEVAELMQVAVTPVHASLGPWLVKWMTTEFDWESQGVELTFEGRQRNLAI
jgi:hypothetical protein